MKTPYHAPIEWDKVEASDLKEWLCMSHQGNIDFLNCRRVSCSDCIYSTASEHEVTKEEVIKIMSTVLTGKDITAEPTVNDIIREIAYSNSLPVPISRKMNAIKKVREVAGWDFKTSKKAVDDWWQENM